MLTLFLTKTAKTRQGVKQKGEEKIKGCGGWGWGGDLQLIEANNSIGLVNFHIQHEYEFSYIHLPSRLVKKHKKVLTSAGLF